MTTFTSERMNRDREAEDLFNNISGNNATTSLVQGGQSSRQECLREKLIRLERLSKSEISRW